MEILHYFELNDTEIVTWKNLDVFKALLMGKFIALNVCIRKKGLKINYNLKQLNKIFKKDQIKSKENIKEKIVKIRTNVNEIGKKLQ